MNKKTLALFTLIKQYKRLVVCSLIEFIWHYVDVVERDVSGIAYHTSHDSVSVVRTTFKGKL